jgi:hypothetical protein
LVEGLNLFLQGFTFHAEKEMVIGEKIFVENKFCSERRTVPTTLPSASDSIARAAEVSPLVAVRAA